MAELTIQISDDLAQRLAPFQERLPELLNQFLDSTVSPTAPAVVQPLQGRMTTANLQGVPQAYLEVLDFLTTQPDSRDILTFKVSPQAQERLQVLLDKNREGTIAESEVAELDVYGQLEHLMLLLKARANAL